MDSLPAELLSIIFGKLAFDDRLRARLCSRLWHDLMDPLIFDDPNTCPDIGHKLHYRLRFPWLETALAPAQLTSHMGWMIIRTDDTYRMKAALKCLGRSARCYDATHAKDWAYGSNEMRRVLKYGDFVRDFIVFRRMTPGIVQKDRLLPRFEMNTLRVLDLCAPTVHHDNSVLLKMTDLLTLQQHFPSSLETLRFTLCGGSLVLPAPFVDASSSVTSDDTEDEHSFEHDSDDDDYFDDLFREFMDASSSSTSGDTDYKHFPGHDGNCDACANPWRSVKALVLYMDAHDVCAGELPMLMAYIMLKFLNLEELELQTSFQAYKRHAGDPKIDKRNTWRNLLDPSTNLPLQSLNSLKLEHPHAGLIFYAMHEFMGLGFDARQPGALPVTNLSVLATSSFSYMFYANFFGHYRDLRSLVIEDHSVRDSRWKWIWKPVFMVSNIKPWHIYASLTRLHVEHELHYETEAMLSKRCPNLKIVSLEWSGWRGLRGDPNGHTYRISPWLRKLQMHNYHAHNLAWFPLTFSTRLEQIDVEKRISFKKIPFIVYVQIPCQSNQSSAKTIDHLSRNKAPDTLLLLAWYHDEDNQAWLVPDPALVLDRLSRREDYDCESTDPNVKAHSYANTHDTMVIFAPSAPLRFRFDGKELPMYLMQTHI